MTSTRIAMLLLLLVSGSGMVLSSKFSIEHPGAPHPTEPESALVTVAPTSTPEIADPTSSPTVPAERDEYAGATSEVLPTEPPLVLPGRTYPSPAERLDSGAPDEARQKIPSVARVNPVSWAPTRVVIPDIGVDASIVGGGQTEDGSMAAPEAYDEVGWYRVGAVPGETGRSVLAGHVDSTAGRRSFIGCRSWLRVPRST